MSGISPSLDAAYRAQQGDSRSTISESLEQLAAVSQRLADLAAKAAGLCPSNQDSQSTVDVEVARGTLDSIFAKETLEGYDGTETMEKARVAHFNAALEMCMVMAEGQGEISDHGGELVTRIGQTLRKELIDFYHTMAHANERVTFTTEQRTALESAFLVKTKLNTAEKRALARTCNLNPRQVEVWVRAQILIYNSGPLPVLVFQQKDAQETGGEKTSSTSGGGTGCIGKKSFRVTSY
jgi:Homeodomain